MAYSTVKSLISKAKKNPDFVAEIYSKPNMATLKYDIVSKVINQLISKDTFIDNCDQVLELVYEQDERARMLVHRNRQDVYLINKTDVNKIVKEMGLRYRKVKHIANTANSTTGKILRQQWAIRFLDKYHKDRVYLNLDETFLGMSDFRRMKW